MRIKEYNSDREKLIFPEYGRHIQHMISDLSEIKDKAVRTRQAHAVVRIMGNLNRNLTDTGNFKHKLWDHFFMMADFKIDIDSPYPIPTREELQPRPEKLPYPVKKFEHKQYGRNIRRIIEQLKAKEECAQKDRTISDIARFMKFKSYEYNNEFPSDEVVRNDLDSFGEGFLDVHEDVLDGAKIHINRRARVPQRTNNRGFQRKDSRSNNNRFRSNNSGQSSRRKSY